MNSKRFRRLMKKSWYRKRIIALSVFWVLLILIVSVAAAMLFGTRADAVEDTGEVYYKYYKSVKIMEGDTLWSYAEQYRDPARQTVQEYIAEVKRTNDMQGDTLVEGRSLVLPYYSTEYICSR
ncbi:MAG: hypothetical protein IK115_01365 [Lachnospiraceae bacterium]|nr:hypothetical protein [Lachnospiraceae bacterium]